MEDIVISEKKRADAIAQEYMDKGYRVSREVVLDFFPGFRADILVEKGDERKVVEVKSRTSLARDSAIGELARVLHSKPGWTFELSLVSEQERLDAPEGRRPFDSEDVQHRIIEADRLLEAGFNEAAYLIAWSALEAMIRILIEGEGISISRVTSQTYILDLAVSECVISKEDYEFLVDAMKYRNALVHGFEVARFDRELVMDLMENTKRLLQPELRT
jgi:uncharacterized protein YutE (UPF0331/DUF86 family)